jgi:chromosome segregation ATPase
LYWLHCLQATDKISSLDSQISQLQEELVQLQSVKTSVDSSNEDLRQQLQHMTTAVAESAERAEHLQQQLNAEQANVAEGISQVGELERSIAALEASMKVQAAAFDAEKERSKQLQQKADQLVNDMAAARESSKSRQEELMKQIADAHLLLSTEQQEKDKLQDETDALQSDNSLLKAQHAELEAQLDQLRVRLAVRRPCVHKQQAALTPTVPTNQGALWLHRHATSRSHSSVYMMPSTAVVLSWNCCPDELLPADVLEQGQLSSRGLDLELLRKKLSAAEACEKALKADVTERDDQLRELRQQLFATETSAQVQQEQSGAEVSRGMQESTL